MDQLLIALVAGLLGGAVNAVAGGGSFITFPALILTGMPPVVANQTSSVALLPGGLASSWAYRSEIRSFNQVDLPAMVLPTVIGGGAGAALLLITPTKAFDLIIPWLVLFGALTFAFGKRLQSHLKTNGKPIRLRSIVLFQFVLGTYGGYFGGAVGIMMMAGWMLFGLTDIRAMNGMKTLMLAATKIVAVLVFAFFGHVYWIVALCLALAAVIGGYLGAFTTKLISTETLRTVITFAFFVVTAAFFYRGYG
jgi:uncharacterized membrane protein YfcA